MDDFEEEFQAFVTARSPALLSMAWVLTGDEGHARELAQETLLKMWLRWKHVVRKDSPDAYARKVMTSIFLTSRRRHFWRREVLVPNHREDTGEDPPDVDIQVTVAGALDGLSSRQRAIVALRYYQDLSERETAAALGCSVATVKTHAARALSTLRRDPGLRGLLLDEGADNGVR